MLNSIWCMVRWAVHEIGQTILTVIDFILTIFIVSVNAVVSLLPNDPTDAPHPIGGALGMLNYFIPMEFIVSQFGLLMTAWILYRVYAWVLRWAKAEG